MAVSRPLALLLLPLRGSRLEMALLHQRLQSVRAKGLYFPKSLLQSLLLLALLNVLLVVLATHPTLCSTTYHTQSHQPSR